MSRPYTAKSHGGYNFIGNRIHPEELAGINAQLTDGSEGISSFQAAPLQKIAGHALRRSGNYNPFRSSILERLKNQPDLLTRIAQVALLIELPAHWNLRPAAIEDGAAERARHERLDLHQELSEQIIEASAA